MLPPETKTLLEEAIAYLRPEHERQKGRALRQLTFKMMNQGLGRSSAFDQERMKIYHDSFDDYAQRVGEEVRRVLEETNFDAYPDCEHDLIQLVNGPLSAVCAADRNKLREQKNFTPYASETAFDIRYAQATKKVATEIKILCSKLRAMKTAKNQMPAQNNFFYLLGPNSRVNQASTDNSVNIVSEVDLFPKLRQAIEAQISDSLARERLLALVSEGEQLPKRTEIYNSWFAKFLSLAADSIGVVQPFIPALAQLLAQVTF